MNWPVIFLGCFVIGFVLSALSFAFGIVDMHVHFPWGTHVPRRSGAHRPHARPRADQLRHHHRVSRLVRRRWLSADDAVPMADAAGARSLRCRSGCAGAAIVFLFMAQACCGRRTRTSIADYDMVGVLGRLTQPIRAGGIGELVYPHGGRAQVVRRAERRRAGDRKGRRSRGDGIRARHRVRANVGRPRGEQRR